MGLQTPMLSVIPTLDPVPISVVKTGTAWAENATVRMDILEMTVLEEAQEGVVVEEEGGPPPVEVDNINQEAPVETVPPVVINVPVPPLVKTVKVGTTCTRVNVIKTVLVGTMKIHLEVTVCLVEITVLDVTMAVHVASVTLGILRKVEVVTVSKDVLPIVANALPLLSVLLVILSKLDTLTVATMYSA